MAIKPIAIVKCGSVLIKVYDLGEDLQCLISGSVKFPELWFTHHKFSYTSKESLECAISKCVSYNHLTDNIVRIK